MLGHAGASGDDCCNSDARHSGRRRIRLGPGADNCADLGDTDGNRDESIGFGCRRSCPDAEAWTFGDICCIGGRIYNAGHFVEVMYE